MPTNLIRRPFADAVRALVPLTPPVPLFGLVFGLVVAESDVVGPAAGWASSIMIFGGASQLASVVVLDAGGSVAVAVGAVLVINARHLMYSAALRGRYLDAPRWFRIVGPFLLVDQVFAVVEPRPADDPLDYRIRHYMAAGLYWLGLWAGSVGIGVAIGLTVGDVIPDSWSLEFSLPLLFLGLLVSAVRDRPGLAAAGVSGLVAVMAINLQPAGIGLLLAAVSGMAAAALADTTRSAESKNGPRHESGPAATDSERGGR